MDMKYKNLMIISLLFFFLASSFDGTPFLSFLKDHSLSSLFIKSQLNGIESCEISSPEGTHHSPSFFTFSETPTYVQHDAPPFFLAVTKADTEEIIYFFMTDSSPPSSFFVS